MRDELAGQLDRYRGRTIGTVTVRGDRSGFYRLSDNDQYQEGLLEL